MLYEMETHFRAGDALRRATPRPLRPRVDRSFAQQRQDAEAPDPVTIRLADCEHQRNQASILLNRMYGWRGYGSDYQLPRSADCVTFTAIQSDGVVGTLTLGVDAATGLGVDRTFEQDMKSLRAAPGSRFCELTKFAFEPSSNSKPALAALFHVIFIYGSRRYGCTDLVIEVNPRHVRFYEAMLGFERVGSLKTNTAVDAPSQLMWLKVSEIRRQIDEYASKSRKGERSLYPYFFSPHEEEGIYARLITSAPAGAAAPDLAHASRAEHSHEHMRSLAA
jgi:hypothetical protein